MKSLRIFFFILPLVLLSCKPSDTLPTKTIPLDEVEIVEVVVPKTSPETSLLRVNATKQSYNYVMPWQKSSPESRNALGAILEGGLVLVTADVVTDATYVSFSTYDKMESFPAEVVAVDYEANLALLRPQKEEDRKIVGKMNPFSVLTETLPLSEGVELWQFGEQGMPIITPGNIQNYEMSSPLIAGKSFLIYKMKGSVQSMANSFSLPVIKDGVLAGMLLSYDSDNQISRVLDVSVIRSFIKDATDGKYTGFPVLGIATTETTDPVFRKYLKLKEEGGGLYVNHVDRRGSAGKAGIEKGDVVIAIDNQPIDKRGYYESKDYGKLSFSHLINGVHKVGDELTLTIMRQGEVKDISVKLISSRDNDPIIMDELYDRQANYIIYGGMVFTELSKPFIKGYGANRISNGLVAAAMDPSKFEEKGVEKIVITSIVIPTPATLGYDDFSTLIVESVNGQLVKNLKDMARILDENKEDIQTITFGSAPYNIYFSQKKVNEVNGMLQEQLTKQLRKLD